MAQKRRRRAYLDDYVKNAAGEYVYTGDHMVLAGGTKALKTFLVKSGAAVLAIALLFLGMGFVQASGTRVVYVVLPYIAAFLPIAFSVSDIFKLAPSKGKQTIHAHETSFRQLGRCALAIAVLALATAAAEGAYLLFVLHSAPQGDLLFLAGACLMAAAGGALCAMNRAVIWVREEKKSGPHQ